MAAEAQHAPSVREQRTIARRIHALRDERRPTDIEPRADRAEWDAAFPIMQAAQAADDAITARYEAADATERDQLLDEFERLGEECQKALWSLFAIPAPDDAALRWKAEKLFGEAVDEGVSSPCWREDIIAAFMLDVRRLLAPEAPVTALYAGCHGCPNLSEAQDRGTR
jgi:hypothetical protein